MTKLDIKLYSVLAFIGLQEVAVLMSFSDEEEAERFASSFKAQRPEYKVIITEADAIITVNKGE